MTRLHTVSAVLLVVPLLAGACGESTNIPGGMSDQGTAPVSSSSGALTATGSLIDIDPLARTLTVNTTSTNPTEGTEGTEFTYDESTQVVGADGQVQALTGQDGSRVIVTYETRGEARHAVRIQVMSPSAIDAARSPGASDAAPDAPRAAPAAPDAE